MNSALLAVVKDRPVAAAPSSKPRVVLVEDPPIDALNFARATLPASKAKSDAARTAGSTPSSLLPSTGFTFAVDIPPLPPLKLVVAVTLVIVTGGGDGLFVSSSLNCGSGGSDSC
jgi:hypothetical protein